MFLLYFISYEIQIKQITGILTNFGNFLDRINNLKRSLTWLKPFNIRSLRIQNLVCTFEIIKPNLTIQPTILHVFTKTSKE